MSLVSLDIGQDLVIVAKFNGKKIQRPQFIKADRKRRALAYHHLSQGNEVMSTANLDMQKYADCFQCLFCTLLGMKSNRSHACPFKR